MTGPILVMAMVAGLCVVQVEDELVDCNLCCQQIYGSSEIHEVFCLK